MLQAHQLSNGNPENLKKFALNVDLEEKEMVLVKGLFDQVEFCKTLHHDVNTANNIEEILTIAVVECEGKLRIMFEKMSSTEEITKLKQLIEAEKKKKENEDKSEKLKLEELAFKRENTIITQINAQNLEFRKSME